MIKQLLGLDDINDVKRYELSEADWHAIDGMVAKNTRIGNGTMDVLHVMNIIEMRN